jgi:hypothetical protein
MLDMTAGRSSAAYLAEARQLQLAELERTLATCASLAGSNPAYRDLIARMDEQFAALSRSVRRSAARAANVSRGGELGRVRARYSGTSVSQAMRELRAEAQVVHTATTSVSAGLRRLAAIEASGRVPAAGHGTERVCADCGEGFASVMGVRRCPVCLARREKRRQADLERARSRPSATRISDGWAQLAEEEANDTRRILRRGDR